MGIERDKLDDSRSRVLGSKVWCVGFNEPNMNPLI